VRDCSVLPNSPPVARVAVSPGVALRLEGARAVATFDARASDDGDGGTQGLTYRWSKVSGPGGTDIEQPRSPLTDVTFIQSGDYVFALEVDDGEVENNLGVATVSLRVAAEGNLPKFTRGDYDASGDLTVTDAVALFDFLFQSTGRAPMCPDAADADDDGELALTDGIRVLNVLFQGIGVIPAPGIDSCGLDPTDDAFEACEYPPCQ